MTTRSADSDRFTVVGPVGGLEALCEVPANLTPRGVAVICHPHPLHGGTLDNKVVYTLARTFADSGMAAIRFNFRGVGRSEGSYGDGAGEIHDARAVVDWAKREFPGSRLFAAGFSFGAMVAYAIAADVAAKALVTVALPVFRLPASVPQPACPWLVVHGDEDEVVDVDGVVTWLNALDPGPELIVLEGATHFFHGRLSELRGAVADFLDGLPD